MRILITDLNIKLDGHKYGYISNMLKYVSTAESDDQYVFLHNFSNAFVLKSARANIKIVQTTEQQQVIIDSQKHYFQKSAEEWKIIKTCCEENKIDHLILMEIDPYQIEIGKAKTAFSISGIWFRPFARMQKEGKGLKNQLVFWRTIFQKKLTMKWALHNKNLKQVFILNDEAMPNWLNSKVKRFFYLPDPYFEYTQIQGFDLRKKYNIPKDNLIVLQFGSMDERKNNENIIAALSLMPDNIANKITLLVIGKFKKDYLKTIQLLQKDTAEYQLILRDEFVSDEEMESTFAQSDVILRMNINFFGSSGIVGQAANHNKPCIVSDNGVMAEQVDKYGLGVCIDPYDVETIEKVIEAYLLNPATRKIDGSKFRETHNLEAFGNTLLSF